MNGKGGEKGDAWELELRAAKLGSRLDGVVTILDGAGKTQAKAEANPLDPSVRFAVPMNGEYRVQIQDRFRSRGGPDFAYRLRIAPPAAADFRLILCRTILTVRKSAADAVTACCARARRS